MIGKEILNYTIISSIGKGGMGTVYLAEHKYIKQQKAAVKILNSDVVSEFTRQRLAEEAEHLARLNHPNIVRLLNYHIDEEGNVYLIMEYAEGVTLDTYINDVSGLIVEDRICALFEPMLDAVGYAHKNNIIHRDLKPSNIIITEDGTPKILDFGIAKIMDNEVGVESEKMIMGTPAYMSPEQVKGDNLDGRSDIYSLGVVLYQMLTGNAPYDITTLSEYDINKKVVEEPLPPMRSFYKFISEKVQKVVDKATAKHPKNRFHTCGDFKKALHTAIHPPKLPALFKRAAIVCGVLLICAAAYLWDYNRTKTYYYKDYVEQWGIPQGIGELTSKDAKSSHRMYKFEYRKRKLQRVSHVNSVGVIITDGESERNERPLDMLFTYMPNGKVSKVIVKDESGKVEYLKSYNDKLNTLVFQYNDDFGTEKILSSQTIGDVNAMLDNGKSKGRISRWLLEYDDNGYVSKISYAGFQNVLVGDADNIYGRKYTRDSKGRIIQEVYLGKDGSSKSTNWGLGKKRFYYDDADNWVKAVYLTIDDKSALDQINGTNVCVKVYDQVGNSIAEYYEDQEGNLMIPKMTSAAGYLYTYDGNGFNTSITAVGIDKNSCYMADGYATIKFQNNELGHLLKASFHDIQGNLCFSTSGIAYWEQKTDVYGNVVELWNYDLEGKLIEDKKGRAGFVSNIDSLGRTVKVVNYGPDRQPTENTDGVYGYEWEYNALGLVHKTKNLNKQIQYGPDKYGAIFIIREYDKSGNVIRTYNETNDGKLQMMNSQYCGRAYVYDDNGNEVEESYFDDQNKPCKGPNGYAKIKREYDVNGFLTSMKYFDLADNLIFIGDEAGRLYTNDERGNTITSVSINNNGKPIGYEIKRTYDKYDNVLTVSFFDDGLPTKQGYHKIENRYNSRNQRVSTNYYDTKGKLVKKDGENYAIERFEYDNNGNVIKTSYFGADERAVACNNGWSSVVSEINALGQIERNSYFGADGLPTKSDKCIPVIEYQYDKWGNTTYYATRDGNGELCRTKKYPFSIYRREFDARGNCISDSYFDENNNPIVNKDEGYHISKSIFDAQGNLKSVSYFNTSNQPMLSSVNKWHKCEYEYDKRNNWLSSQFFNISGDKMSIDGYHKRINTYDTDNKLVEYKFYDVGNKPVNAVYGYHKVTQTYKENGDNDKLKTYTVAGGLVNTYTWDGTEWQQTNNWKSSLRTISSSLPHNYGGEYGNIVLKSAKITGDRSCTLIFSVPYSLYAISDNDLAYYKEFVEDTGKFFEQEPEFRASNVYVTVILYDNVDRQLHTAKF